MNKNAFYFCGVGGNGMSPLARLLVSRGHRVIGSDRSFDLGRNLAFFEQLAKEGIQLVAQDGTEVDSSIDYFIVTRAVEETIPDVQAARQLNLRFLKRPELMQMLFKETENVSVAGTSGKSTTTGMIGHILTQKGIDPTVMNGALMVTTGTNFRNGSSSVAVFEADESDGYDDVVCLCPSTVAVLTNISLDHFSVEELRDIFSLYIKNASRAVVLNAECPHSMTLRSLHPNVVTFGLEKGDINASSVPLALQVPGDHNILNALAAIAACEAFGVDRGDAAKCLTSFRGIHRRLETVGSTRGISVIDDFASNPGKIAATLHTLKGIYSRLAVVFQPHGFYPAKMMREGYKETFEKFLSPNDILLMPEIFYVGGSHNVVDGKIIPIARDISSENLIQDVHEKLPNSFYFKERADIVPFLAQHAQPGDAIVVMGSRDETLPDFAHSILTDLLKK